MEEVQFLIESAINQLKTTAEHAGVPQDDLNKILSEISQVGLVINLFSEASGSIDGQLKHQINIPQVVC